MQKNEPIPIPILIFPLNGFYLISLKSYRYEIKFILWTSCSQTRCLPYFNYNLWFSLFKR